MMDRVTRYPIFSIPHSAGMGPDADTSYMFKLVNVQPSTSGGGQDQPQAWAADHKAQLDVARLGALRSQPALQAQRAEDEEMKAYHLDTGGAPPRRPWDLERERWAVIQGQAVRKSGTVATLRGPPDRGETQTQGRPQPLPLEENVVDREQIDFLAARQQFLSLEQENLGPPQKPAARDAPTRAPRGVSQAPSPPSGASLANGYAVSVQPQAKEQKSVPGLSTGSGVQAADRPGARSPAASLDAPKETPIEREIRLAQEREAALRKQRGLRQAAGLQELVAVPARPLLTSASLTTAPQRDRGRPSLYVQRDMVQETKREEDHRREGRQLGRASTPAWVPEDPRAGLRRAISSDCVLGLARDAGAADPGPEVRRVNRIPADAYQPFLSPGAPRQEPPASHAPSRPGGASAERARRPVSESAGKAAGTQPGAGGAVLRRDCFRLRPLRFGVPEGPQKAEAPRTWGWEEPGALALRLQRTRSSELLEREVQSVLRREREVAEERRSALYPEVFSPPPEVDNDADAGGWDGDSRSSSAASGKEDAPGLRPAIVIWGSEGRGGGVWASRGCRGWGDRRGLCPLPRRPSFALGTGTPRHWGVKVAGAEAARSLAPFCHCKIAPCRL